MKGAPPAKSLGFFSRLVWTLALLAVLAWITLRAAWAFLFRADNALLHVVLGAHVGSGLVKAAPVTEGGNA